MNDSRRKSLNRCDTWHRASPSLGRIWPARRVFVSMYLYPMVQFQIECAGANSRQWIQPNVIILLHMLLKSWSRNWPNSLSTHKKNEQTFYRNLKMSLIYICTQIEKNKMQISSNWKGQPIYHSVNLFFASFFLFLLLLIHSQIYA